MKSERERLDKLLVARGLVENRTRAQALILAGKVHSEGRRLDKPGTLLRSDQPLEVDLVRRFASRGAHKLIGALDHFDVAVDDQDALDIGSSTGGFTEVLLDRGASRVIALDVGRGLLDWKLRNDSRVIVLEGVNARYLEPDSLPYVPQLATIDVSFIGLDRILPAAGRLLAPGGEIVTLVKPQFEVGRGRVGRGGIVRDPELHREVLQRVGEFAAGLGWGVHGACASPIHGAEGNREFFLHLRPTESGWGSVELASRIAELIDDGDRTR